MKNAPIRILAVDDHVGFREGIASLLADQPDMKIVAEASGGLQAIREFRATAPDITLMDLQMPGMDGLTAIRMIRAEFPDAKFIVLTTFSAASQLEEALRAGAAACLPKSTLHRRLLHTIRDVYKRK